MERIIWSSDINVEDWREDFKFMYEEGLFPGFYDSFEDIPEEIIYDVIYDYNAMQLEDERSNLDIPVKGAILVIADLGLWNGRHFAFRILTDANVSDIFNTACSSSNDAVWYVNEDNELCCDDIHHDGTNHYCYRRIDGDVDEFIEDYSDVKYENGIDAAKSFLYGNTESLGGVVSKIYGW